MERNQLGGEKNRINNYLKQLNWEDFAKNKNTLYWFRLKDSNLSSNLPTLSRGIITPNEVITLGAKWESFEFYQIPEVDTIQFRSAVLEGVGLISSFTGPIRQSTKEERIEIMRSIYQDSSKIKDIISSKLAQKGIVLETIFKNFDKEKTGKDFFQQQLNHFLNLWFVWEPVAQREPSTKTTNTVQNNYVYYIQYTLKLNNYSVNVDGNYGNQTANAVTKYQADKKLNPYRNEGIVDSETKACMATYWLDLYKNNKAKFEKLQKEAPEQAKPYIQNALKYSDIAAVCNGSSSDEYRRISYTGIPGPTTIQDFIVVEVPQLKQQSGQSFAWQELLAVEIKAGGWPLGVQQIFLYEQDLAVSAHSIPQFAGSTIVRDPNWNGPGPGPSAGKAGPSNLVPVLKSLSPNTSTSVPIADRRNIKYIMIEVVGKSINDGVHGPNAEGFSIQDISFKIRTPGTPIAAVPRETTVIDGLSAEATATGVISGETFLDSGDYGVFSLGTIAKAISSASRSQVTQIKINEISMKVVPIVDDKPLIDDDGNPVEKKFSKSFNKIVYSSSINDINDEYNWEEDESTIVVSPLSGGASIEGVNLSISQVEKISPTESKNLTSSEIASQFTILTNRAPQYLIVTTNGVEVISDEFSEEYSVDNFYLADADITDLKSKQNVKLSVNAKDGIVVLTDSLGNPAGMPDFSKFIMPNVETSFGNTIVKWDLKDKNGTLTAPPDGLQWGFYNIRTKQFLGIKLSYQYYLRNKRDVYIAVHAYDADRDASTLENIIGLENRVGTLSEFSFPAKNICPLYLVRVSSRPKIYLSTPPKDLSKFDQWFVNLSRGRFYKKIEIPINYPFYDWKKNYKGKELRCFYDTTRIEIPSSPIFGSGYYDIIEENPIVLSENEIQVRHGSFHVSQVQTNVTAINKKYTDASPIKPWIDIYIQNSKKQFELIDDDMIKNFDKHTGRIFFEKEIVPSDPQKIKVNYVVKNPNIMLYNIQGNEIPLNPYSNFSGLGCFTVTNVGGDQVILQSFKNVNANLAPMKVAGLSKMYFYILPTTVEELVDGEYVNVSDYQEPNSIVDYSFNTDIFNNTNLFNPFALYIGAVLVNNLYNINNVQINDLRVKGGGIAPDVSMREESEADVSILSFNDIQSGRGKIYPNGGYVIVQIPDKVRSNFQNVNDIYDIVRSNLTAGVAFDIQDMNGNDWRTL